MSLWVVLVLIGWPVVSVLTACAIGPTLNRCSQAREAQDAAATMEMDVHPS